MKVTVDYKKFLADYADQPPSPKKKKDIKTLRQPSKQCIRAQRHIKTQSHQFATKPTMTPVPSRSHCKGGTYDSSLPTESRTITNEASTDETQQAVATLLSLGHETDAPIEQADENEVLMPINLAAYQPQLDATASTSTDPSAMGQPAVPSSTVDEAQQDTQEETGPSLDNDNNKTIPPGTILRTAIKVQADNDMAEHNPEKTVKKEFVTKTYSLKRKNKLK